MCGIGGILGAKVNSMSGALERMRRGLEHRGPDDRGVYLSTDSTTALVHTRLSIIDLSAAGHQPMATEDGRFWITFNGEIYNYRELRSLVQQLGACCRTESDTEVILHLYQLKGPSCVSDLRGMFAFAIWDAVDRSCFLARDVFGIKPLYYCIQNGRLVFASELKALLDSGLASKQLDPTAVEGYFAFGSVQEPSTLVQDVHSLRAGHTLLWKDGIAKEHQHSKVGLSPDSSFDRTGAVRELRLALEDSVRHHFVSDVPVGLFLSGGIDSTALLALAKATGHCDLRTFSIRFAERDFDEGDIALRSARHFGSQHSEWQLDAQNGRKLVSQFLGALDQPSIDGFNTFVVSKFARDQGMKVVLSGLGGDELFGGYPSFQDVPRLARMARRLGPTRSPIGAMLEAFASRPSLRRLGHFLRSDGTLHSAYEAYRGIFVRSEARRMAIGYTGMLPRDASDLTRRESDLLPTDEVSLLELSRYMRNQLLRDSDVMSMAFGLELRVPFLDQKLLMQLGRLPADIRLQPGKKLLLDAVPEIPNWVASRPKRGFVFPFTEWFNGEWQPVVAQSASRFGVSAYTWYQKWAVFVFEQWREAYSLS